MLMSILMLMRGLWVTAMGYNSQTIFIKSTENSLATIQERCKMTRHSKSTHLKQLHKVLKYEGVGEDAPVYASHINEKCQIIHSAIQEIS